MVAAALALVLCLVVAAGADTIRANTVVVEAGGTPTTYDFDQVKLEEEDGVVKVCVCKSLAFRALQLLSGCFADGVVPRDDIRILTGWTTDGAGELFVDIMGWPTEDLAFTAGATEFTQLNIADAYFIFIRKSTGRAWRVTADEALYPKGFFPYRTLIKSGQATNAEKQFFQTALRPQAVANMEAIPLIDKLDIRPVAFFGTDGILRIPTVCAADGSEYEIELRLTGDSTFTLEGAEALH
ncbi:MAG: hypothetical protein JW781_01145 [Deltaproteobacteria bacterium]|nr:hypothetical protein [Candidatus Anaeroferrophillacea bacterium]